MQGDINSMGGMILGSASQGACSDGRLRTQQRSLLEIVPAMLPSPAGVLRPCMQACSPVALLSAAEMHWLPRRPAHATLAHKANMVQGSYHTCACMPAAAPSPATSYAPWAPKALPHPPSSIMAAAPAPDGPAAGPATHNNMGPIPGLAVSYEVVNVSQPVRSWAPLILVWRSLQPLQTSCQDRYAFVPTLLSTLRLNTTLPLPVGSW